MIICLFLKKYQILKSLENNFGNLKKKLSSFQSLKFLKFLTLDQLRHQENKKIFRVIAFVGETVSRYNK